MAEHGSEGPVIGVAYDGTGLGTDGAAWGGEIMVADYGASSGSRRSARSRSPAATPRSASRGASRWRSPTTRSAARRRSSRCHSSGTWRHASSRSCATWCGSRSTAPLAHGVGRYFDGMAALGLGRHLAAYEGQLALEWNVVAASDERGRYRYDILRATAPWQLDLRSAVRDAVFELVGGEPAARVSARFHNTLVAATADLVRGVACVHGRLPVALSGGCFQNPRLTEGIVHELEPEFTVLLHAKSAAE